METNTEGAEVPENITDYKNLFDLWLATKKQNAALKEAIIELIPMAEQARDNLPVNAHPAVAMLMNKRIERAKKLLNEQPQSESDGDENLS